MVATIEERIREAHRERTARLATRAAHYQIEVEAGGYIVRNPRVPGRIEVVSTDGVCSCGQWAIWHRCKHAAIVETRTRMQP